MENILKALIVGFVALITCSSCEQTKESTKEVSSTVSSTTSESTCITTSRCSTTTTATTFTTTKESTTSSEETSFTTTFSDLVDDILSYETETIAETYYEEYTDTSYLPIQESDRILLCNLVAREYGSDYVSIAEKAKVVAVVMNRVNSPQFPNNVYDVVMQPNQFSTDYISTGSYSSGVTDSVIESVNYYFEHQGEYSPNIFYFVGDGQWNYFS